jgi:hypothetical protein
MAERQIDADERQKKIQVVERFLEALNWMDMSDVPLAPDVVLKSPLTHPRTTAVGEDQYRQFLSNVFAKLPPVKVARVHWHLVEGDHVVTRWELELGQPDVVVPILDHFVVTDGLIMLVEPFFDPRPFLAFTEPAL